MDADGWTWATNLFSAVLALGTLVLTFALARRLTGSAMVGLVAAIALALSPTFLAQSVVANIRMPTAFLAALLLYTTVRWLDRVGQDGGNNRLERSGGIDWGFVAVVFVAGLAVAHHTSLFVFAGLVVALVLAHRPRGLLQLRTAAACAIALVLSLAPVLYLPIRDAAGAPYATGTLGTARGLLEHVTGYGFRGDALYIGSLGELVDRLLVLWNILGIQFGPWLLLASAAGIAWLLRRRPLHGALVGGSIVALSALAITYRAPQTMEYLLPVYLCLALCIGVGAVAIVRATERFIGSRWVSADGSGTMAAGQPVAAGWLGGLALILVLLLMPNASMEQLRSILQPRSAASATRVLRADCLTDGGTVLANWHHATPLSYAAAHIVHRPDIEVAYVYPEGAEPIGETWRRRATETRGAVVATNRSREMIDGGLALWPLDGSRFFGAAPDLCPQSPRTESDLVSFADLVALTAHAVDGASVTVSFDPLAATTGRAVTETLTIFAQLVDPSTGEVWGQVDRAHVAARWADERGLVDRLVIAPYRGAPAGPFDVVLGLYRSTPIGPERLHADRVEFEPGAGAVGASWPAGAEPRSRTPRCASTRCRSRHRLPTSRGPSARHGTVRLRDDAHGERRPPRR